MATLRGTGNPRGRRDRGRSPVSHGSSRIRSGYVEKPRGRGRGRGAHNSKTFTTARQPTPQPTDWASNLDTQPSSTPGLDKHSKVKRATGGLSACTEWSLAFVSQAGLETDDDTNIMTLNLMDHFLFSKENWVADLSYCKLHAACFLVASRITGKQNTVEQIAAALGNKSEFVKVVAEPMSGDGDEAVAAVASTIGVSVEDLERGYGLLYERKEVLRELMGEYGEGFKELPVPDALGEQELQQAVVEEIDFDVFEE